MAVVSVSERRLRKKLAQNLRRARAASRLSVITVADEAGMHWRHLQKIEDGEVGVTLRTLAKIADALKVTAAELLR